MTRAILHLVALLAVTASALANTADSQALVTVAERSGFRQTGRYDEVIALCNAFAKTMPAVVRCIDFGRTPEGRPMKALVVSTAGAFTPEAARAKGLPVVLIQGGIHAGEIDGKDAGFLALREMLYGKAAPGALTKQVLLFVPVFNIDGHERFGAWNRPNQRGPEQMGWRTTAQNYNLNRDYAKADAPEMQAMLRLVNEWDPLAVIDLHVTDGAKFQHDVSIQVEPVHAGDEALRNAGKALRDGVIDALKAQGSLPVPFYMSFVEDDNPASGFEDNVSPPRFSTGYFMLRNRMGMLVEAHSWKDYPTRVKLTRNTIVAVVEQVAANGAQWLRQAREADTRAAKLAGQVVALDYKATDQQRTIDFQGYAYTRTPSDISGALMTRYDETKPEVWHVPLRDHIVPHEVMVAPGAGYLVPPAWAPIVEPKLKVHAIAYKRLPNTWQHAPTQTFRASKTSFSGKSFESHQTLNVEGEWKPEPRDIGAGALFVPIAQPKAQLVMALLEPKAPDSLLAWGFFNNAFEQKEYMEAYVAEDVAREQLKSDPKLAAEFQQKLKSDEAFAKDPAARLEFFYRRHPSWDERLGLYPVMRVDVAN
jgi:hypothetical protein